MALLKIAQFFSALILLLAAVLVKGDYIFSIELLSFSNPTEQLAAGRLCCDVDPIPFNETSACPKPCNTTIQICTWDGDRSLADFTCSSAERLIAAAGQLPVVLSRVTVGPWPGSIQLYISAIHDMTGILGPHSPNIPVIGDLIDDILLDVSTSPVLESPLEMELNGTFNRTTFQISFDVTCTFDYYGPDCNTFCEGGRNDSSGHFTCDPFDGSIICLEGYQNITSNCTECVPLNGCSLQGGFCNFPGECNCREGYSGHLCTMFDSSTISSGTFSSTTSPLSTAPVVSTTAAAVASSRTVVEDINMLPTVRPRTSSVLNSMASSTQLKMIVTPMITPNIAFVQPTTPSNDRTIAYILAGVVGGLALVIIIVIAVIFIALSKTSLHGRQKRQNVKHKRRRNHFIDFGIINNETSSESVVLNNHNATDTASIATQGSLANSTYVRWNSPDPTVSTFLDSSSEAMMIEEKQVASVVAIEDHSVEEDCETPVMEKERMMEMDVDKLSFHSIDETGVSTFGFPNPEEELPLDLGEDLLSSIEHTLSYSSHNGNNVFPSALLTNSQKSDGTVVRIQEFSSFIYSDMVEEKHKDTLHTPSLSPDSMHLEEDSY